MRTFYESDIRRRTLVLSFALAGWAVIVALRLVQVQVFGHARAKAAVLDQTRDRISIDPRRGNIFDRNGEILASSQPAASVFIRPVASETPAQTQAKVRRLKDVLGLTDQESAYVTGRLQAKAGFSYVSKRKFALEDAAKLMALKLAGVGYEPATKRHYPHGPLAAHVLGGINLAENSRGGIEARYNDLLKGVEGLQISYKINGNRGYENHVIKPPVPGRDLYLTIDATIQYIAEKELAKAVAEHDAAWGAVIIEESGTGDILALASWPAYDVNDFPGPREVWLNRAIGVSYEPGSVFKIITAAAALERGRVGFSEIFDCSAGFIRVGGTTITDHVREYLLSFPQVLVRSSNVGTVQFAQRITVPEFSETIKAFGIGAKTRIDLPAEEPGNIKAAADWIKKSTLAHIAIGYEVMVTPLQIVQAMNVYATGGLLVRPRIVRGGSADAGEPVRAIGEKTASELVRRVFEPVVEEGTAKDGRLAGYRIAGKTGTARRWDSAIDAYTRTYTASFVGFTPVGDPRLTMIVVLDQPKDGYYGGEVCAPVFRDIARQVLRYLRVPPERAVPAPVLTAGAVSRRAP